MVEKAEHSAPLTTATQEAAQPVGQGHPYPSTHDAKVFQPIPPSAYAEADKLLNAPNRHLTDKIVGAYYQKQHAKNHTLQGPNIQSSSELSFAGRTALQFEAQEIAAKESGVTVIDSVPTVAALTKPETGDIVRANMPVGEVFDLTADYLDKFNIDLTWAQPGDTNLTVEENLKPVTTNNSNPEIIKQDLLQLVTTTSGLTKEYVDKISNGKGLHFDLAANSKAPALAYTFPGGDHNQVVFNVGRALDADVETHELGHDEDAAEAGGSEAMMNDPAYTVLNGIESPYSVHKDKDGNPILNPRFSAETFREIFYTNPATKDEGIARRNKDWIKACEDRTKEERFAADNGQHITVATPYGTTNPAEDKAELSKIIMRPNEYWGNYMSKDTPRLREKFRELFARFFYYDPQDAKYAAALAVRNPNASVIDPTPCNSPENHAGA
jgi:hypothetical protein